MLMFDRFAVWRMQFWNESVYLLHLSMCDVNLRHVQRLLCPTLSYGLINLICQLLKTKQ